MVSRLVDLGALRVHAQAATAEWPNGWPNAEAIYNDVLSKDGCVFAAAADPAVVLLLVEAVERAQSFVHAEEFQPHPYREFAALVAALEPFTAGAE